MTQTVVLDKLARYLELTAKEETKLIRQVLIDEGYCFGFSLCYSFIESERSQWEDNLIKIATWDGTEATLAKIISADKFLDESKEIKQQKFAEEKTKKNSKLNCFDEVLNYVVFNHAIAKEAYKDFMLNDMNQISFLNYRYEKNAVKKMIKSSMFELLKSDGTIKCIQDRVIMIRHFTVDILAEFLRKNVDCFYHMQFLISNVYHAITLCREKNKWLLYDPNYDHQSKSTIRKEFFAEEELAKEIIAIQGYSLVFRVISLDQTIEDKIIIENASINDLKEFGLYLFAVCKHAYLSNLLEIADKTQEGRDIVAEPIAMRTINNSSVFHVISPELLVKLIAIGLKGKNGHRHLANALMAVNSRGDSALKKLHNYSSIALISLLEVIGKNLIIDAAIKELNIYAIRYFVMYGWSLKNKFPQVFHVNIVAHFENAQEEKLSDEDKMKLENIHNIVSLLIEEKVDVNAQNDFGDTALHWAVNINDYKMIVKLLAAGANPSLINKMKFTPLQEGLNNLHDKLDMRIIKLLQEKELQQAIQDLNIPKINEIFASGADPNIIDLTKVFYKNGTLRIPNVMIEKSEDGQKTITAMHNTVAALIAAGANINGLNAKGYSVLHLAAITNDAKLAKRLCELGVDIHLRNIKDQTAFEAGRMLHRNSYDPKMKFLQIKAVVSKMKNAALTSYIREDLDISAMNLTDVFHRDPPVHVKNIMHARSENELRAVASVRATLVALISLGLDVNQVDADGNTVLHWAAMTNDDELFKHFYELGADVSRKNFQGETCFAAGKKICGVEFDWRIANLDRMKKPKVPRFYRTFMNGNALDTCKKLLIDYTKNNSRMLRFLTGHWNRQHLADIHRVLNNWGNYHRIQDVYHALTANKTLNDHGSLMRRLRFCASLNNEMLTSDQEVNAAQKIVQNV